MIAWKISRGRQNTVHAYDLPMSMRAGMKIPSLCRKREYTFMSAWNDEGPRCRICERRARDVTPTSGDIDI